MYKLKIGSISSAKLAIFNHITNNNNIFLKKKKKSVNQINAIRNCRFVVSEKPKHPKNNNNINNINNNKNKTRLSLPGKEKRVFTTVFFF